MWSILASHKNELSRYRGSLGSFVVEKFRTLLETPDYADVDHETAYQFLEFYHKFENSIEASDSWFDTSGPGYLHYWECDGDHLLNWKDRGYKTVLDILMVGTTKRQKVRILLTCCFYRNAILHRTLPMP